MRYNIYVRNGVALVPTLSRTEAGYFLDTDPVEVVPAADVKAFECAVARAMGRGNPRIPTPGRAGFPVPVVLKHAQVRSWSQFEKGALSWLVVEQHGRYQIIPGRKCPDGGWEDDLEKVEVLPDGSTPQQIAEYVVRVVQTAIRKYEDSTTEYE